MHPDFRKKHVVKLTCKYCEKCVCTRGMKAVLLADTAIQLFSTDSPCQRRVSPVGRSYCTKKCKCQISDIACTSCGNVVGYQVMVPCTSCLRSCNNGHVFIFKSSAIYAKDRISPSGAEIMRWESLPEHPEDDTSDTESDEMWEIECCR